MRAHYKIFILILCCVAFAGHTIAQGTKAAAIIAAMNNSAQEWNKGDLEDFMKMYTDSSTMMYPTGPVGLSSIRELYEKKYFNGKMPKQNLSYSEMKVIMLGDNYALLTGKFNFIRQ